MFQSQSVLFERITSLSGSFQHFPTLFMIYTKFLVGRITLRKSESVTYRGFTEHFEIKLAFYL